MEIKYFKSCARLVDRDQVNKGGLDLSKEILWVSVGQWAADLQAVKVGGQRENLPIGPLRAKRVRTRPIGRIFFSTSNFDSPYLCCPLTYKDPQYLFGKI